MKYIISAGGTGGHIYPALEIAIELDSLGHEVRFYAANKKIDKSIIERENLNFKVKYLNLSGFQRSFKLSDILKNFVNVFKLIYVSIYSIIVLATFKPHYVVGFGGYVTFPFIYFAKYFKIHTAIHEQNSFPGLVNRKLSKRVDKVFYTFDSSLKYFERKDNTIYTSNPRTSTVKQKLETGVHCEVDTGKQILFVGGSLGAQKINDIAIKFASENSKYTVLIVTGERYYDDYQEVGISDNVRFIKYLSDPIEAFLCAQVVVSRSGASTLVELMSAHTLSVFIPSPNVVADHQTTNASEFVSKQMATMISEDRLDATTLSNTIDEMIKNEEVYKKNMEQFNDIDSKEKILEEIDAKLS